MMNVNLRLLLGVGAAVCSFAASAQTTTHHTASTTHRTTARSPVHTLCVAVPDLSPKIPTLPAAASCPKALFTIGERLDYISPMVGPEVREDFSNLPMIFTLAYVDTQVGTGELAKSHMWYTVQYTGYLPDGTKFDSSLDHPGQKPLSFPYGGHRVIPGWDLGFEGMHVGGKRRLFIPYQLAYGERGRPPMIPPKSELVFDMELIAQSPTDPDAPPAPPTPPLAPGTLGQPGTLTPPNGPARPSGTQPPSAPPAASPSPTAPAAPAKPSTATPQSSATPQ